MYILQQWSNYLHKQWTVVNSIFITRARVVNQAPPCNEWKVERRRTSATDWWGCWNLMRITCSKGAGQKQLSMNRCQWTNWNLTHPPGVQLPTAGGFPLPLHAGTSPWEKRDVLSVFSKDIDRVSAGFLSVTCESPPHSKWVSEEKCGEASGWL